jgi:hypothetical protein
MHKLGGWLFHEWMEKARLSPKKAPEATTTEDIRSSLNGERRTTRTVAVIKPS